MLTAKRQHKPITITKPVYKSAPILAIGDVTSAKAKSSQKVRTGYKLCPDGSMINAGEKCPEASKKASR